MILVYSTRELHASLTWMLETRPQMLRPTTAKAKSVMMAR